MKNRLTFPLSVFLILSFAFCSMAQQPTQPAPGSRQTDQPPPYYDYPYGSETRNSRTLSVQEAVALALDHAAALRQAQFDELSATEDVKQARAALLPQFNVPLTYWGTTPSTVRNPGDPLTFSFVSSSAINETVGTLSVTGTIDVAGRLRAQMARSRALLEAAHAGTQIARRNLALATIDAYYGLVLARQRRRLADEALALAESFAAVTEEQHARGSIEETDVLRARSAARSRRDELEQARLAESIALSQLRVLTGVDYATYIAVVRLTDHVPNGADFLRYQEDSINARAELTQLDAQKRAAIQDRRAARRELFPQLTYTLNAGFDAANFRPLKRYSGGDAIITLNVPIFNFGASKSRAKQAELRARALDAQRETQVLELKQEFYAARAGALSALDRIRDAADAATASQQNLNLVFQNYRSKKSSLLEIIDAQSNYSATRLEYYQAIVDYFSSRARLEIDPTQIFKTTAGGSSPTSVPTAACTLNRDQAPSLGGLRLGMTEAEVRQLVPSVAVDKPDELGVSRAELKTDAVAQLNRLSSLFEGVDAISLEFVDGRLSFIRAAYPVTNKWSSKDQFLSVMAPKFQLQGRWKPFYDWQNKDVRDSEDLRDLGIECAGFRLSVGIGIEGLGGDQTPHYELDDMVAARVVKQREEARSQRDEQKPKP